MERMFLFYSWIQKNENVAELMRDQAILTGAFSNPQMAQRMTKKPDYSSSDEDMEKSWEMVRSQPALDGISERPRKRRVLNG